MFDQDTTFNFFKIWSKLLLTLNPKELFLGVLKLGSKQKSIMKLLQAIISSTFVNHIIEVFRCEWRR